MKMFMDTSDTTAHLIHEALLVGLGDLRKGLHLMGIGSRLYLLLLWHCVRGGLMIALLSRRLRFLGALKSQDRMTSG